MKRCDDCAWDEQCQKRDGKDGGCKSFWQKPAPSATGEIKKLEEMIYQELRP